MRRRIVIGLIAVAVVGIGVLAFCYPRRESAIDYHRRKLTEVRRWTYGTNIALTDYVKHVWNKAFGRWDWYYVQEGEHILALTDLGYLEQRAFVVSNRPQREVCDKIWARGRGLEVASLSYRPETNVVSVVAAAKDMPAIEKLIREADVP